MIQIVQLHGTDKKLYELVAPLVMSPEVLKQNYNYPFRTSEEYEWFVALDNKHVVGFVPVEHKKYECVINNYYIKERNVDTLKLLLEKVLEKQGEESSLRIVVLRGYTGLFHLLYTDVEFLLVVFLAICGLGAFVCEYLSCQ